MTDPRDALLSRAADEFAHIRRLGRGEVAPPVGATLVDTIASRAAVAEAMCRAAADDPIITNAMSWAIALMAVAALNEV